MFRFVSFSIFRRRFHNETIVLQKKTLTSLLTYTFVLRNMQTFKIIKHLFLFSRSNRQNSLRFLRGSLQHLVQYDFPYCLPIPQFSEYQGCNNNLKKIK